MEDTLEDSAAPARPWYSRRSNDGLYSLNGRFRGHIFRRRPRQHNFARKSLQYDETRPAGNNQRPERGIHGFYFHRRNTRPDIYSEEILRYAKPTIKIAIMFKILAFSSIIKTDSSNHSLAKLSKASSKLSNSE